ncbi:MAG: NAD-dependent epimerase/dehydratase family protein [Myxococcota bacterium]
MGHPLDAYRAAPVVVLGAGGFIGRWVARALTRCGADLSLGVRDLAAFAQVAADWRIEGSVHAVDLSEPDAARALCAELRPAVVFNLAGYGVDREEREEEAADRLNRRLPEALAGALAEHASGDWPGRSLVHAGSALEYGPLEGPVCESLPSRPDTLYGRSKWAGARAIAEASRASGLRAVEGRIFTAYGPGERPGRLLPSLLAARDGDGPIALSDGRQPRDFVYVEDVAEALLRLGLCREPGFEVVHVATGVLHPVRRFVEVAAEVLALDAARLQFGARGHLREEMWHGPVSVSRLRERLDWTPARMPREGVAATLRAATEGLR